VGARKHERHAMTLFKTTQLTCRNCNAGGVLTLQSHEEGPGTFVSIAGSFHVETGRTTPASSVIVCSRCDEIHGIVPGLTH